MKFWNIPTLVIFWILLTIFLGRFFMLGQAIYGDGIYYWAYVRSIVIDHDLDLRNEAAHLYSPDGNNTPTDPPPAETGLEYNKYYPVGPAIMWLPAFFIAHVLAQPLEQLANGYADHYQIAVGVLNVSYILVGLVLLYKLLLTRFNPFISFMTTALLLFATNLIYYGSLDILNSHPSSFFIACLTLTLIFKLKKEVTRRYLFFSGICVGLLALIRPQDLLFGILFLPFFFERNLTLSYKNFLMFSFGGFLTYLPQVITSFVLFGTVFALPYMTSDNTFSPTQSHLLQLFFLPSQGLLFYSPIYLMGIGGLFLYLRQNGIYSKRFIILLVLEFFLISIWSGWSQGEAFGLRMIISLLPILAFGIAEVLTTFAQRLSKSTILSICFLFVLQNFIMILAFHLFLHESTYIDGEITNGGKIREEILQKISEFNKDGM